MPVFDQLLDDYATKPVPGTKTISGLRLALIIIGVGIAIPGFIAGAQIGTALGFYPSFYAFTVAGMMLTILGSLTAIIGARTRLTTYKLVEFAFGRGGGKIVSLIITATLFGWFGVNAQQFGDVVVAMSASLYAFDWEPDIAIIGGACLMIVTTIFGFKAIDKLALLAVPLLLAGLLTVLYISWAQHDLFDSHFFYGTADMSLGLAISAVVGANMVTVTVMPDLARYVRNSRHALLAIVLSFFIGVPFVLISAAAPALITGHADLIMIITGLGFSVSALFIIIFSTWTSNANNLYSASLSIVATFPYLKRWKSTLVLGVLGTLVALSGITNYFIGYLLLLGAAIPPIAGIYIVDYIFIARGHYDLKTLGDENTVSIPALTAWVVACLVAFLSIQEVITLTSVPACDALFTACIAYGVIKKIVIIRKARNTNATVVEL